MPRADGETLDLYVGLIDKGKSSVAQDVAICDLLRVTRLVPLRARRNGRRED